MYNMMKDTSSEMHEKLSQELRRGILVLATLSQLDEARYGYALIDGLSGVAWRLIKEPYTPC